VCVEDARIAYVGPRAGAPAGERVDLGDCILVPGLVNAHTHLELTAMRGFLEDLPFRPWILRLTKARQAVLTPERLRAAARAGIAEGLLSGVTSFADTSESGVSHLALREMGVRGVVYQEVFGPRPEQCDEAMAGLRERVDTMAASDTALVCTGVSPHAPYSVSDALFTATTELALVRSLPIAIHAAESEAETALVRDATGAFADALRARGIAAEPRAASPIRLLARVGALRARPLLVHCVRVDRADIRLIADAGCAVAHCPASNAKLGHGIAPVAEFLAAGIRVGLGTDSVASNNRMDMLDEARLSILMQRARLRRPDTLSATHALELATLGAARAVGLGDRVGSLEIGKAADIAAFPLDALRDTPTFEAASALVFAAPGRMARLTMVAGEVLVRDGRLLRDVTSDLAGVTDTARDLAHFAAENA
jgi:cytosine/adenosine deaminase-related metal-dependent hydrolase